MKAEVHAHVNAETNFYFGFDFILFQRRYFFVRHLPDKIPLSIAYVLLDRP